MQRLGSHLSMLEAELANLHKKLAPSMERAKLKQMVRDYKERGVSS